MAGMLGAQCGAQHSQVDNNGNTQRHRCPYEEPNVCESVFIRKLMCMCKYVVVHIAYVHTPHVLACVCDTADIVVDVFVCVCVSVLAHWY